MNELQAHQAALADASSAAADALAQVQAHAITDTHSAGVHDALSRTWIRNAENVQTIAVRVEQLQAEAA